MEYDMNIYKLWLNTMDGIENYIRLKLLYTFGNAYDIYNTSYTKISAIVGEDKADIIAKHKDLSTIRDYSLRLEERDIKTLFLDDTMYPEKLKQISAPPSILYVRGNLPYSIYHGGSNLAVVGGRAAAVYDREIVSHISGKLAAKGITIISGMARGIDSAAHMGALKYDGCTIAVLGSGINVPYPRENVSLYENIMEHGAIISEYGLEVPPLAYNFPMRNRIISGLSDGVLVASARKKSGSLITTDFALDQGRQIYVIPGRAMDKNYEGSNNLIKQGASCVTEAEEILIDLQSKDDYHQFQLDLKYEQNELISDKIHISYDGTIEAEDITLEVRSNMNPDEERIYNSLGLEPKYIDEIVDETRLGVTKTISVLFSLEEKKIIKQPTRGYYIISLD